MARAVGIDPRTEVIPVSPAAHPHPGGDDPADVGPGFVGRTGAVGGRSCGCFGRGVSGCG